MGTESVAVNMEYSPLNKFSSSGDEVEQFNLPAAASCKQTRPKRRRKRKEFDSLRSHTLNSLAATHCCHVSTCLLVIVILVLMVTTCALAVMLFYMSNTVSDIEQRLSNLQIKQSTASSSLLAMQNKVNIADNQLRLVKNMSENSTANISALHNRLRSLETEISSMKSVSTNMQSSQDNVEGIRTELAKLGSQVLALESESANLKQRDLSLDSRLGELDSTVRSLSEQCVRSSTASIPTAVVPIDGSQLLPDLNETHTADINALQLQLNRTQHEQDTMLSTLAILQQEMKSNNESLKLLRDASKSCCNTLTYRVDQLETSLREMHEQLTSLLTTSFEHQLVNQTILSGTEDIISRVINQKTSSLQRLVEETNERVHSLETQLERLQTQVTSTRSLDSSVETSTADFTAAPSSTVPSSPSSWLEHVNPGNISSDDLKELFGQKNDTAIATNPFPSSGDITDSP